MACQVATKLDKVRWPVLALVGLAALLAPPSSGQQSAAHGAAPSSADGGAAAIPVSEVASVKPNKSGDGGMRIMFTPDGVSYTNIALQMLLRETFGIEDDRILGAPSWVKTDRFDIEAKVDASDAPKLKDLKFDERRKMLLPVLADRFNLKFHHESRELPTCALVIAKGSPKLKEATPGDTYPNGLKGPDGHASAGAMMAGRGKITGQGVPIATLVNMLAFQRLDRAIFDKTGLTGKYDFELKWAPDEAPPPITGGMQGGLPMNDAATDPGPSLFTALQEQLGLKLEPQKGPIDVIVIDHIERPSENY
jgi:uncharacterized protein (TIGR03435 family)